MLEFKSLERISATRTVIVRYVTASNEEMKKTFRGVVDIGEVGDFVGLVGLNGQTFYFQKSRVVSLDCCSDDEAIAETFRRENYVDLDLNLVGFEV